MNHAMILCAGFGTRLKEYTKKNAKPMLPINDRPLLEYTISHLASQGINNIVINLHYLKHQIISYFEDGRKWGVNISYILEDELLGTSGSVRNAKNYFERVDNFLVLYGDILTNQDYKGLFLAHIKKKDAVASIILHEREHSNSVVEMDGNRLITRFVERPKSDVKNKKQNWVNSGLYCFSKEVLDFIPNNNVSDFPKDVFPKLLEMNKLYGYPLSGYRCAVDSPSRYKQLQKDFSEYNIFQ